MEQTTPSYRVGDAVVVKPGAMSPDNPGFSVAGWQGWVTDLYPQYGTLGMKWDSVTLRSIPRSYIRECLIAGLGWESMGLEPDDVLPATPRDTPDEADAVYEEIMTYHRWDYLADFNPGISDLLGPLGKADTDVCLQAWDQHLRQALRFPFEARVEELLRGGDARIGDIVQVQGIADFTDRFGLYAHIRLDRRQLTLPLCELEAIDYTTENYQPLNDYVIWFAHR